jgi:hypothetical protein
MNDWKVEIVGKTINRVSVVEQDVGEDTELLITFSDGSSLTLYSFGWAEGVEGVAAEGSEIAGEFKPAKNRKRKQKTSKLTSDHKTYVGIKPCGCKTSAMVDDGFTPDEIQEFIRSCEKGGMTVELHDKDWVKEHFGYCETHMPVG